MRRSFPTIARVSWCRKWTSSSASSLPYLSPSQREGERTLKIGKLKSGRHARRAVLSPDASLSHRRLRLEQRTSGATDLVKKPPLWWQCILTCWYASLRFRGFGFLSLKKSRKQHAMISPSLEHLHAFLQDSHINNKGKFYFFRLFSNLDANTVY